MIPLALAIPVIHSSGAWIAYAGTGYLAGTLSSTWIGTFILGNAGIFTAAGLVSGAGVAGATGLLAGAGATAAAGLGAGLTSIGLGGVASWLGVAPAATFLGLTPMGWAIGAAGTLSVAAVGTLFGRKVMRQINEERAKGGLEPTTFWGIIREVKAFEKQSKRDLFKRLEAEGMDIRLDPETSEVELNGSPLSP